MLFEVIFYIISCAIAIGGGINLIYCFVDNKKKNKESTACCYLIIASIDIVFLVILLTRLVQILLQLN